MSSSSEAVAVQVERGKHGPLVGAVDQGTSSTRFLIFAAGSGEVLTYHQEEVLQHFPQEGWVEQDPMELLNSSLTCISKAVENLKNLAISFEDIKAVGITNQRETTIVWDKTTGVPLYNAIVWLDVRTTTTVDSILERTPGHDQDALKSICGLPISTYFSAVKLRWLLDNVPAVKKAKDNGTLLFGTVDTWLLWNLTGGVDGGLHITDVTNASRTMLLNLKTLKWDPGVCKFFDIPLSVLPEIRSSSEIYGYLNSGPLHGVPISGLLGDQQAALVGQMCLSRGQAKNTYGTGCFLLYNTGSQIVWSNHGLLTTVGYQFGATGPVVYALEGSVAIAGAAVRWLRDNVGIIKKSSDIEGLASKVKDTAGVYFVPAFSGLYAPYWRSDARGTICGITQGTTSAHLARAALEAVCFQTREILDAMQKDSGISISKLLVDGGMTANNLLLQLQADIAGVPVVRPSMVETTALGAAMAAGAAAGIAVWDLDALTPLATDTFTPAILEDERERRYDRWCMAVERSMGWELLPHKRPKPEHERRLLASAALFALGSILTFILADHIKNSGSSCQSHGAGIISTVAADAAAAASFAFTTDLPSNGPSTAAKALQESCVAAVANVSDSYTSATDAVTGSYASASNVLSASYSSAKVVATDLSSLSWDAYAEWFKWAADCYVGLTVRVSSVYNNIYNNASNWVPSCCAVSSCAYAGYTRVIGLFSCSFFHNKWMSSCTFSNISSYAYSGFYHAGNRVSSAFCTVRSWSWSRAQNAWCYCWPSSSGIGGGWVLVWCRDAVYYAGSVCCSVCARTSSTLRWLCTVVLPQLCSSTAAITHWWSDGSDNGGTT